MDPYLWQPLRPFSRALVVVAHPDDGEFGAGGTIAALSRAGTEVRYLVLTDGASGSADAQMSRERLAGLRAAEQRAAADRLGATGVDLAGYADGYLQPTIEARRVVAAAIRRHRPELVMTLNPEVRWSSAGYINHPDHRAVGDLVLHSINPAASTRLWDTTLLDEGLEPWDVAEVWLMSFGDGELRVDVTDVFDAKVAALREHVTQLSDWDPTARMRQMSSELGAPVGVELAESFTRLQLRVLDEDGSILLHDAPPTNPKPRR